MAEISKGLTVTACAGGGYVVEGLAGDLTDYPETAVSSFEELVGRLRDAFRVPIPVPDYLPLVGAAEVKAVRMVVRKRRKADG